MAGSSSATCEPLSDTTTYTYTDLENGFTPSKSCLEHSYTSAPGGYDYYVSSTTGVKTKTYLSLDVYRGRDPACFPPNFPAACSYTGTFEQPLAIPYVDPPSTTSQAGTEVTGVTWSETHYVYSPATCPDDYATVSTRTDASSANLTSAVCCPMGFSLVSNTVCQSHCSSVVLENRTMTFSSSVLNLFAPTIKVAWHTSDIIRWRSVPATSTPTALLAAPTSTPSTDSTPAGMSTGAQAGIGVGVAAVAIGVIAAVLIVWRRRTKWRKIHQDDDHGAHKAELSGEGKKHAELADEVGVHETEATDKPKEVAEQHAPAELESDWTGWEVSAATQQRISGVDQHAHVADVEVGQQQRPDTSPIPKSADSE